MLGHAVAHMALEAVAGMGEAEPHHQPVARDLGDDGSRGDRQHQRVARDHRLTIAAAIDLHVAIDEDELRPHRQRLHRARQRPERGAQDVVAIDAVGRAKRHRHFGAGANLGVELFARRGIELLGIVQAARDSLGIEHHRGRHHRSGERPPARLVAAGDRPDALVERAALAPEARAQHQLSERQAPRLLRGGLGGFARLVGHGEIMGPQARRLSTAQQK